MTPESRNLLQGYVLALTNEAVYAETKSPSKSTLIAKGENRKKRFGALVVHIEKLERSAKALESLVANLEEMGVNSEDREVDGGDAVDFLCWILPDLKAAL